MPLQIRRGTNAERLAMTVPLAAGELLWVTDQQRLYIGNGASLAGVLTSITGYTNEDAQDAAAQLFQNGVHNGISFTYGVTQDGADRIDATVNLTSYSGPVKGDLTGSVFADNSTRIIDGTNGKINLDGTINGNIIPDANSTYDIGSSSYRFKDLYLSGSTIYLGSASISASGSTISLPATINIGSASISSSGSIVDLPAGTTIAGVPITGGGGGDGVIQGNNYNINIIGDDSTFMVNTSTKVVSAGGGFNGNLTGNVTGNVVGDIKSPNGYTILNNGTDGTDATFTGSVTGNVIGVVYAAAGSTLIGNSVGYHTGDMTGSVFADDSTMLVDGTNGVLNGSAISAITTNRVSINRDTDTGFGIILTSLTSDTDSASGIDFKASRGSLSSPTDTTDTDRIFGLSGYVWKADQSDYVLSAILAASVDGTYGSGDPYAPSKFSLYTSDGVRDPFEVGWDMSYDGNGVLSAPTVEARTAFQLPVYADDTARSTAIPSPAIGMMIFMQSGTVPVATNNAQVYNGSAWVNL